MIVSTQCNLKIKNWNIVYENNLLFNIKCKQYGNKCNIFQTLYKENDQTILKIKKLEINWEKT